MLLGELAEIDFLGFLLDRLYFSFALDVALQASESLLSLVEQQA